MTNKKSEIYAQGYEKWDGERGYAVPPWLLIGKTGFRNVISPSGCLGRFIFIFLFIIPLGNYFFMVIVGSLARFQLENLRKSETFGGIAEVLANAFSQANFNPTEATIHMGNVLIPSIGFSIAGMIFYGAQLISKDKWSNALQVYFSKAISRVDYVLGKFVAVGMMTGIVSLLPSAVILIIGLLFSMDHASFFLESWYVPILTTAYWLILTATIGSVTLFFSSCFNKAYMAAVGIIGFQFFCFVFSKLLIFIFGSSNFLEGFNWTVGLYDIGTAIYKWEVGSVSLFFWQVFDLLLIIGVFTYLIFRNIRPVEVVK